MEQARGQWNTIFKCQTINMELNTQSIFQEQEQKEQVAAEMAAKLEETKMIEEVVPVVEEEPVIFQDEKKGRDRHRHRNDKDYNQRLFLYGKKCKAILRPRKS